MIASKPVDSTEPGPSPSLIIQAIGRRQRTEINSPFSITSVKLEIFDFIFYIRSMVMTGMCYCVFISVTEFFHFLEKIFL